MRMQSKTISIEKKPDSITRVVFETIKIGIIKSNLIAMTAGLSVAIFVHRFSFFSKIGNIVLDFDWNGFSDRSSWRLQ